MSLVVHAWLALITFFWGLALLLAVVKKRSNPYRLTAEDPGPQPSSLTVIVPARNEEHNIADCLDCVLSQDLDTLRVVVLDDDSSDQTGQILARYAAAHPDRLEVLQGDGELPADWLGKPWACQRAADHALAQASPPDWLLFIDADVRLHPRAASVALARAQEAKLDLLSGLGKLEMVSFWEKVIQPVVGGLIVFTADIDRINDPSRSNPDQVLANGQFMLTRSAAYRSVGGHAAVKNNVLDDVGLALAFTRAELSYQLMFMNALFSCRMYSQLSDLWDGWTKNFFAGMGYSWSRLAIALTFIFLVIQLPYLLVLGYLLGLWSQTWLLWGLTDILLIQAFRSYLDRVFKVDPRYGITHGPATFLLDLILIGSAIRTSRGTTRWKGRTLTQPGR